MKPAEEYILTKPEPFRSILLQLQLIIESSMPELQLKYKWHLPFYYFSEKEPFCYMNQSKDFVDLVFWHGTHLTKHPDVLVTGGRKHFKSLRYFSTEGIHGEILAEVLAEAASMRGKKYYK
jgi:hypothetical protein